MGLPGARDVPKSGDTLDELLRVSGTARRDQDHPPSASVPPTPTVEGFLRTLETRRALLPGSSPDGQSAEVGMDRYDDSYVPLFRVLGVTTWTQSALMAIGYTLSFVLVQMVTLKTRARRRATPEA